VSVLRFFVGLAGHHLIPAVLASGVVFFALWLLFGLGRLRRPPDRAVFLFVAMLKAAVSVWEGEGVSCLTLHPQVLGYLTLHLPNLVPSGPPFEPHKLAAVMAGSGLARAVLLGIAVLGFLLLCYRWVRLAPVYRRIFEVRAASARDFPHVFRIFLELVDRAYGKSGILPRPRLLVIRAAPCPAFTMGIRPPIVVLSAELAESLATRELQGVLAHELAHVRRIDYVVRWAATVLRDIMVWNPFVVLWYNRLVEEQESASDAYAAELLGDPVAVASGLVEVGAHTQGLPVVTVGPLTARRGDGDLVRLQERLTRLEERVAVPGAQAEWSAPLRYPALAAFLVAQPHFVLPLADLYLFFRHAI
jgi:Zn-dependent protease with chaperone function